jgi:hypothetical protein
MASFIFLRKEIFRRNDRSGFIKGTKRWLKFFRNICCELDRRFLYRYLVRLVVLSIHTCLLSLKSIILYSFFLIRMSSVVENIINDLCSQITTKTCEHLGYCTFFIISVFILKRYIFIKIKHREKDSPL